MDDVLYLTEHELSDLELRGISQEAAANRKDIFQRTAYLACIKGKKKLLVPCTFFFIKIALFRKTQRGLKMNLRLILNCNFLIRVPVNFFKFIAT